MANSSRRRGASNHARAQQAIGFLEAHQVAQPSLAEVAQSVGLSASHFQRLFVRQTGVSPKDFLAQLTLRHAKHLLARSAGVLESSHAVGLSGPSRLHDLFVKLERMTPAESQRGGGGLTLHWGIHPTPLGDALFAASPRGLCHLEFLSGPRSSALLALKARWPNAQWKESGAATRGHAHEFERRLGGRPPQPLSVLLRGTDFQLQVWEALLRIPEGTACTYGDLARNVGCSSGARAVGNAVGQNPVAYFIPCHRVIRASGAFGDYRWGVERKRALLAWEHLRPPAGQRPQEAEEG